MNEAMHDKRPLQQIGLIKKNGKIFSILEL